MRLRAKLGLFTSLTVLLTAAAVAFNGYLLQKRLIEHKLAEAREDQSESFAAVCRQSLLVNNELLMLNYVKLLQDRQGVAYSYFVDPAGKILVHSYSRFFYKSIDEWTRPPGIIEAVVPVAVDQGAPGRAVIGFTEAHQQQELQSALDRTVREVSLAAAAIALIGLAAALLFAYVLTRPLRALSQGSEEIAKGNFATRVEVASADELGELAGRFNSMAQSLAVLDELKDEFISSVSHDLRNPMAAIQMYADHLLNGDDERDKLLPRHRQILVTIMDSARRLGLFVTNILDAAKIKAGRMEYHLQPVPLESVAQNVHSLFGIVAQKRNIMLLAEIPPALPDVSADPERFEQVVANLVSNALKFTGDGGRITLGGRAEGDRVLVFVADSGRGIPKEDLPKLFQRFTQAEVARQRTERIKGTGLGLYIVRTTVEGMGGTIGVESELGKGTRFTISLPKANGRKA